MFWPLVGTAAGLIAGAWVGGSLVKVYDWTTDWRIDAPRADVYRALTTPEANQRWWPSMLVERIEPQRERQGWSTVQYQVIQAPSVRRVAPPFRIRVETTDMEAERRTRAVVTGDLAGVLETLYSDLPDGGTRVVFHWYVRVTNPLLNALGYLAEPMYRMSHDHVMREGEAGLRAHLRELAMAPATRSVLQPGDDA